MTYAPLLTIVVVLVFGAALTLTILWRADRAGLFRNLRSGGLVIFDEDEPLGEPRDQLLRPSSPGSSQEPTSPH